LKKLIQKNEKIDLIEFMRLIVGYVARLHSHNIVHGNMSVESIIFDGTVIVDCPLFK